MHLVRATAWRRHGSIALAAAEAAAFISCHAGDPEDTMHAYATLALIANDRQGVRCLNRLRIEYLTLCIHP